MVTRGESTSLKSHRTVKVNNEKLSNLIVGRSYIVSRTEIVYRNIDVRVVRPVLDRRL